MIRTATRDDIAAIVELHERVLAWSINGRLGRRHLTTMYLALFEGADIVAYLVERNGQLLGFLLATTDYSCARSRTRSALGWRGALRILAGALARPADWIDIFETVFVVPRLMRRTGLSAELLAWVADPKLSLGRVAGYECMMAGLAELRRRGHPKCLAQVLRGNPGPNKFHERLGSTRLASLVRNTVYVVECCDRSAADQFSTDAAWRSANQTSPGSLRLLASRRNEPIG